MSSEKSRKSVVLAYSGGLDTSCILVWLREQGYDVIAFMADVGQDDNFEEAAEKAMKLGAIKFVIHHMQKELVEDFVIPAVQANLIYEDRYLLGTALARPCIVRGMIKVADEYNAEFISHGATGKGNDQIRFELGIYALRPQLKIIAPWKDPDFYTCFKGRQDLFEYAKKHDIPLPVTPTSPWSIDGNIIHISYESGMLEDPAVPAPPNIFQMTRNPEEAPDLSTFVTISFTNGIPTVLEVHEQNEILSGSLLILLKLNELGSLHGIGRIDIVENRYIGLKSRGLYETPGLTILREAHLDLEGLCVDREVRRVQSDLSSKMANMVYNGYWYSPECEFIRQCISISQKNVTGYVKLKLYKGKVYCVCRSSPMSLYNQELVSMDVQGKYEPLDASGFIKINAVRLSEHRRLTSKYE